VEVLGDETADHARQQDAEQQPGHDRADHLAAVRLGRQRSGGGHDVLRHRRGDADQQARDQQHADGRRCGGQQQGQGQRSRLAENHAAAIDAVTQRGEEKDARGIAELRQRRDPAHFAGGGADVRAEHAEHRLAVVERGDRQARTGGEQQHQRAGQGSRRLRGRAFIRCLHGGHSCKPAVSGCVSSVLGLTTAR
jgi:hypothetical protein